MAHTQHAAPLRSSAVGVVVTLLLLCAIGLAQAQSLSCLGYREEDLPPDTAKSVIKLAQSAWTTSQWNNEVARIVLREYLGIPAVSIPVGPDTINVALAEGKVVARLELWSGELRELEPYFANGSVVDAGLLGVLGRIGWYWPSYVVDKYPWAADIGSADAATLVRIWELCNYTLLHGPKVWAILDTSIVENNGWPLKFLHLPSEEELLAAVFERYARHETFMFYMWSPHWIFAVLNLTRIALPAYIEDRCDINDRVGYNCDFPLELLRKAMWTGLKTANPDASTFLSLMSFYTKDHIQALYDVQVSNMTVYQSACKWVLTHKDRWMQWTIVRGF